MTSTTDLMDPATRNARRAMLRADLADLLPGRATRVLRALGAENAVLADAAAAERTAAIQTAAEAIVLETCGGQEVLRKGLRALRFRAWRRDIRLARVRRLQLLGAQLADRPLRDRVVGVSSLRSVVAERRELATAIRAESVQGFGVHERLAWWLRVVPFVLAALDLGLLVRFIGEAFNVDVQQAFSARSMAAVCLALMVGLTVVVWMALLGMSLRAARCPDGHVNWRSLSVGTWLSLLLGVTLCLAVAGLLFLRVRHDLGAAALPSTDVLAPLSGVPATAVPPPAPGLTATLIALGFALVSLGGNLGIAAVHTLDGSPAMHRARRLSAALARRGRHIQRTERRLDRQVARLQRIEGDNEVALVRLLDRADACVARARALINASRAEFGLEPLAASCSPLDLTAVEAMRRYCTEVPTELPGK